MSDPTKTDPPKPPVKPERPRTIRDNVPTPLSVPVPPRAGQSHSSPAHGVPALGPGGQRPRPGVPRSQPTRRDPEAEAAPPRRKRFEWKVATRTIPLGDRPLLMAILNVTPDSFSDGGKYFDPDLAYARALQMEDEGADIIDIGAESTRPGSERISEGEELRRLIPVLKRLKGNLTKPIAVDTYKSGVAAKALEYGADIINDPTGLTFDPNLAKIAMQGNAGLVINHMRGTPDTWNKLGTIKDLMGTISAELDASVNRARHAGVIRDHIVIDPGIGFGKRKEQNAEIIARLPELAQLEMPILVGPSRKQFLRQATEMETEFATAAAVTAAILAGAHILRIHDIKAMKPVMETAEAIFRALEE